ncbi:hypothetical protein WMY93_015544 [Mugilogobius chulae]|uniref:G-protein coupled receptors family 1 profile domain-containing protein n=1 Tax=Mugilogobius chulae TaxID=88201 RepID=A0AAW0NRJ0_9GOBI
MDRLNLTSANLTNFTNALTPAPSPSLILDVVPAVVLSLCFLVGFPGNVAVLILRPNWQQLSRLSQFLMMNLALSDLLSLITLPVWIYTFLYEWTLGILTCKIVAFFVYCSLYSSLMTITALSVQRYVQVVHPHRCPQFKKRLLALMWLVSVVFSIPSLLFRTTGEKQGKMDCLTKYSSSAQEVAVLLTESFVGFSALIITSCSYILLNRKLNQNLQASTADMDQLNLTSPNFTFYPGPPSSFLLESVVPSSIMSLCFLIGFPGNVAVLILKPNWQQLSRLTQCLMMNLACSDLLCLVTLPVWIYAVLYGWALGAAACKIVTFLVYCSIASSVLTITALSVQRYMQIVHPQTCLQYKKRLFALFTSALTVTPAVVLSLCFLIGFPGNLAVLILRPNWQQLSRLTQSLMMNLALSDLLCLLTLPVWIYTLLYNWTLGVATSLHAGHTPAEMSPVQDEAPCPDVAYIDGPVCPSFSDSTSQTPTTDGSRAEIYV